MSINMSDDDFFITNGEGSIIIPNSVMYNVKIHSEYFSHIYDDGINIIIDDNLEEDDLTFIYNVITLASKEHTDDHHIDNLLLNNDKVQIKFIVNKYDLQNILDICIKKANQPRKYDEYFDDCDYTHITRCDHLLHF